MTRRCGASILIIVAYFILQTKASPVDWQPIVGNWNMVAQIGHFSRWEKANQCILAKVTFDYTRSCSCGGKNKEEVFFKLVSSHIGYQLPIAVVVVTDANEVHSALNRTCEGTGCFNKPMVMRLLNEGKYLLGHTTYFSSSPLSVLYVKANEVIPNDEELERIMEKLPDVKGLPKHRVCT